MDIYGFYTGKIFDAYDFLGCHLDGNRGYFRTYAPNASRVTVIGEFTGWKDYEMNRIHDGKFWELITDGVEDGMMYKYRIYGRDGSVTEHCDPYGFGMELRPDSASIARDMNRYVFHDTKWMRDRSDCRRGPLNIYEIHAGSWKTNPENENGWYKYNELADILIPYLKENGYNYVEMMPIAEHPCDNSWGYQSTGFYSPTSRYGTADELREFIDKCHQNGIGVLLDFVPVHFAVDGYGLSMYDGTAIYEYPNCDVGYSEWGSKNFNHSRGEVQSYLQSCANYWLKEYHFDGLRMDAISNIIYWQGDSRRGINRNALQFLQYMNRGLKGMYPSIILAAEDSSPYPGITKCADWGGLGFDYKWDLGWMNDTLIYFKDGMDDRIKDYHKLTFSMMYYYSENFILPFSHDEVVHGKATIMQKMNGQYDEKFPQARALYMYMYTHPGKKLNFMGNEIGQLREWDETREQDWDILKYPVHDAFHRYMMELNKLYLEHSALWEKDFDNDGFKWIDCHEEGRCIYAYERRSSTERLVIVCKFTNTPEENYYCHVEGASGLKLLMASDADCFDGPVHYDEDESVKVVDNTAEIKLGEFCTKIYKVI
ncbi:MAG TPA: 1,4-alpha-glucan branching protein GlgB [Lachnospiraceae bacterium]|nr:1,4-alpha-glucan branching protein GlgB [Lachnospiraceae bacterium]